MTPEILAWSSSLRLHVNSVLEIGSLNVNGTLRDTIAHGHWFGTDMREGKDVDFVCPGERLSTFFGPIFDCLVCAETLEHCEDWRTVLKSGWDCLRGNGFAIITAPGHDFPRHEYPSDYWRFSPEIWDTVFDKQLLLFNNVFRYPHIGTAVAVQKVYHNPLNLDVEVLRAP